MGDSASTENPVDLPRNVLDNLLEGCQVISQQYRYLYVNEAVVKHGRATRDELLGRTMMECYPGIENTEMFSVLRNSMDNRIPARIENQFTFADGSTGWFELRFEPVPEGVTILSVDITERKRSELMLHRALRAMKTLSRCNQTLVRATNEKQFAQDVCDLVVETGNYRAARIGVRSSDQKADLVTIASAGDTNLLQTQEEVCLDLEVRSGEKPLGQLTICGPDSHQFDDEELALVEEIALDIGYGIDTLRARVNHAHTEEKLVAAQRLEAVGRLAGGVAHDFNNLLSVILAYAGFAAQELHEADPIRKDIEQVRDAGQRAATLTRQLLAFSRKQILEPRITSLNSVIEGIESMLQRLLGEDIQIRICLASELGNVLADPAKLEQVVMNLAVNARDAMPTGGRLTIETDNVSLDEGYADEHLSVEPGRYVRLAVTDTGAGMDAEICNHIFEPFFTTKEAGKGTGLGLSMVYGIVKQSGGHIWVYSEVDNGTTFKIYLPRVDAPVVEPSRRKRSTTPATASERVLLVEDEPAVRGAAQRILQRAGYLVSPAANGGEALLICEKHPGQIDLLLTDVVMPEMSGRELAERLKRTNSRLKVLFTSGYTDNAIAHHGVLDSEARFISKPFSPAELTRKVREVLDEE